MEDKYSKWSSSSRGRGTTHNEHGVQHRSYRSTSNNYRPRFQEEGTNPRSRFNEDGARPRFHEDGTSSRPRFNSHRGGYQENNNFERPTRSGRPRFQASPNGIRAERVESGYRPRYNNETEEFRPRYNNNEESGRPRQRFSRDTNNRSQGNIYTKRKRFEYQQKDFDPNKPMRLNKYLANAGICSRREADDFIQAGVITVNGEVVTTLGAKVMPTDRVMFHDQSIRREHKVYILLNKPKNCVTTCDDPQERKTVLDIVKNACAERIYPVGRLDRNTTGVLLLTNDGDLAAKLTHPKYGKKKIYAATLDKDLTPDDFATIMQGVILDDERIVPDALEFTKEGDQRHIGLEIHSGQNRVVRRIFEKVGYKVLQLDRVSFAGLTKKNVSRGKYRFLTPKEVSMLQMGAFE